MKDGKRVYLFLGQEDHLKEKALQGLKTSLLDAPTAEFNYNLFYGNETSAREILACASILPFSGSNRLVVVKRAERLKEEDKRLLLQHLSRPNHRTFLVLDSQDESILEAMPGESQYIEITRFDKIPDFRLLNWIDRTLRAMGKTTEATALELLKELFGKDQGLLRQELEKLVIFAGNRPGITLKDVEAVVGESFINTTFDLTDAIGRRDTGKALLILKGLLSGPGRGSRYGDIVGAIAWHLKKMMKRSGGGELAGKLEALLKTDLDMKLDRMDPRTALEALVVRLCLGQRA